MNRGIAIFGNVSIEKEDFCDVCNNRDYEVEYITGHNVCGDKLQCTTIKCKNMGLCKQLKKYLEEQNGK